MNICILAAGYATRLYPLTEHFPKPLLPVGEKTILDWLVDDLEQCGGAEHYAIVSNHRYKEHFDSWASAKQTSAPITVLDDGSESNETRLGAVRDVQFAIDALSLAGDLMVLAGDNVLDFSLSAFLAYARRHEHTCVMRYEERDTARLRRSGVAQVDADDRILRMEEKPAEPFAAWCIPPFYYYKAHDLGKVRQALDEGCGADAPGSFIAWLAARAPVYAMRMPGARHDIGNLETYRQAQAEYKGIVR